MRGTRDCATDKSPMSYFFSFIVIRLYLIPCEFFRPQIRISKKSRIIMEKAGIRMLKGGAQGIPRSGGNELYRGLFFPLLPLAPDLLRLFQKGEDRKPGLWPGAILPLPPLLVRQTQAMRVWKLCGSFP
jgi:hypothetical protein